MMHAPTLPDAFLKLPVAHRALHDRAAGRPENSREAVQAAVAAGYAIEIDLQLSADGGAVVFHDDHLKRLTGRAGAVQDFTTAELAAMPLLGGDTGIPSFEQILHLVAGRVPLLVEIKDQDGAMGEAIGALEAAAAQAATGYDGPLAFMSFNPHSVIRMGDLLPDVARGITTCAYAAEDWPQLDAATRTRLADIPDVARAGASFVSHQANDLNRARIRALKAQGLGLLCWTIRSPEAEAQARRFADNVTFEGYMAAIPA